MSKEKRILDDWGNPDEHERLAELRLPYLSATTRIIAETFESHFRVGTPILELGAGAGTLSYLIPPEYQPYLLQTDLYPQVLQMGWEADNLAQMYPHPVDIQHLPFANNSYRQIVSLAAFDVLPDLNQATREIRRVLAPQGVFVHFQDLTPSLDNMIHTYQRQKLIPFPHHIRTKEIDDYGFTLVSEKDFKRFVATPQGKYRKQIRAAGFSEAAIDQLVAYAENPILGYLSIFFGTDLESEITIIDAMLTHSHIPQTHTGPYYEVFAADMTRALNKAGFTQIDTNYPELTVVMSREKARQILPPELHNRKDIQNVIGQKRLGDVSHTGPVRIGSRIQVIIAHSNHVQ